MENGGPDVVGEVRNDGSDEEGGEFEAGEEEIVVHADVDGGFRVGLSSRVELVVSVLESLLVPGAVRGGGKKVSEERKEEGRGREEGGRTARKRFEFARRCRTSPLGKPCPRTSQWVRFGE